ncbi:uncharacterized protein [Rutidosis leptorrhynchoides]|uniref:uncharacterized protein n=1 Tax=Rutidosis leptorrhynchoides TaxID=125765 RepID=UPI003A98D702
MPVAAATASLNISTYSRTLHRSRLIIDINDETGSIQSMICSPEVEQFIPFTGLELRDSEELGINVRETIQKAIQHQKIAAFLRSFEMTSRGQPEVSMTVVKAYKSSSPSTSPNASAPAETIAQGKVKETGQYAPSTTLSGPSTPVLGRKQGPRPLGRDDPTKKTKPSSTWIKSPP